ncbi:hypothetical protein DL93DRAFT_1097879 [Clavulina sp. PMI_390]|nr:hypothetical protein DL93DRAFT_1097879 [Clavulina sp. PMI_390]
MSHASEKDLLDLFYRMLATPGRKFLVIDAVDECRRSERLDSLLPFLQEVTQMSSRNNWDFRIFATSRPEPDIEQLFDPSDGRDTRLISHRLRLGEQPEHLATVAALIDAELNSPRFSGLGWSHEDFCHVKEHLLRESGSM